MTLMVGDTPGFIEEGDHNHLITAKKNGIEEYRKKPYNANS